MMTSPRVAHPLASDLAWKLGFPLGQSQRHCFEVSDVEGLAADFDPHAPGALKTGGGRVFNGSPSDERFASSDTDIDVSDPSTESLTVEAMIYHDDTGTNLEGVVSSLRGDAIGQWIVGVDNADKLIFNMHESAGNDLDGRHVGPAISTGAWHHIMVVWDAGTVTFYLDGVSSSATSRTATASTWGTSRSVGSSWVTGDASDDTYHWDGALSKLRVWSVAKDATYASWSHNNGNGRLHGELTDTTGLKTSLNLNEGSGNAVDATGNMTWTDTNTVTSADGPSVTTVADNTANNHDGVFSGSSDPNTIWKTDTPHGTFNPTCRGKDSSGPHGRAVGYASDGSDARTTDVPAGSSGTQSMAFASASSQRINLDHAIAQVASNTVGSISAWFKIDGDLTADGIIVSASDKSDAQSTLQLYANDPEDGISLLIQDGGVDSLLLTTEDMVDDGEWHHVAVVVGSSSNVIYLDGSPAAVTYGTGNATTQKWFANVADLDTLRIGNRETSGGNISHFNGVIDDVRIYNDALTADEVTYLNSHGASGTDPGTANLVGRWDFEEDNLRSWFGADPGLSLDLAGTDDHVQVPANAAWNFGTSSAFTLEGWFKFDGVAGDTMLWSTFDNTDGWQIYVDNSTTISLFAGTIRTLTVPTLVTGTWYHIVVTRPASATAPSLHLNSVLIGQFAANEDMNHDGNAFGIGGDVDGTNGHDGRIYLSRLDDVQWTAAQVYDAYTNDSIPSGLVAEWQMDDGPQSPVADQDPVICLISNEGNRYQLLQEDPPKRPLARLGANGINGYTSVEFDGSNDLLVTDSLPAFSTDLSGTLSLVFKTGSSAFSGDHVLFAASDTGAANNYLEFGIDSAGNLYVEANDGGTVHRVTGDTVLNTSTVYQATISSSGSAWTITLGGADETLTVTTANSGKWFGDISGLDNMTIGGRKDATENSFFEGLIGRVLDYDNDISDSSQTQLDNHLIAKYGATV